jgi:hypothetical protein
MTNGFYENELKGFKSREAASKEAKKIKDENPDYVSHKVTKAKDGTFTLIVKYREAPPPPD